MDVTLNKPFLSFFLIAITLFGFSLVSTLHFGSAQTGTNVIGIISSNTTWAPANSPFTLSGPTAVNVGITLTIEPGVTVNINGYYIQVNGTLTAIGTTNNMIQFNGGVLRFTPVSTSWNDITGAGCTVQYANLSTTSISASIAIKLDNDMVSGSVQVGDSSVISNNNISPAVTAGNFCRFINNQVNSSVTAGNSSTITNNNIEAGITAGDECNILSNTVVGGVVCSGSTSVISNNNIQGGQVTGGSIAGNTISSVASTFEDMNGYTLSDFPNVYVTGNVVSNNKITNGTIQATQTVTNNVIVSGTYIDSFRVFGGYADFTENSPAITTTGSPTISGNTITGGGTFTSAFIFSESNNIVPAIDLTSGSGTVTITNDTIFGNSGLAINGNCSLISNNTITGDINGSVTTISNNIVNGSLNLFNGTLTVSGNNVTSSISVSSSSWLVRGNTAQGITTTQGSGYILDNYVAGTYNGIGNVGNGTVVYVNGTGINVLSGAVVERNYVFNSTFGILVANSTAIILNNTLADNGVGIALFSASSSTTINYNNIEDNGQSIVLEAGTTNDINAANNWWGTTNSQAINQSIHDFKNDFNLGTVNFNPFSASSNPEAMPNLNIPITIPESPQFLEIAILFLSLLVASSGLILKKRLKR